MSKPELEHLGIKITRALDEKVDAAVNRGDYATKSELVRAALRQLFEKEETA